jgi:hypothetical protein
MTNIKQNDRRMHMLSWCVYDMFAAANIHMHTQGFKPCFSSSYAFKQNYFKKSGDIIKIFYPEKKSSVSPCVIKIVSKA